MLAIKNVMQTVSVWKDHTISVTQVMLSTSNNINSNYILMSWRKGRRMETKCYQTSPDYNPERLEKQGTNLNPSRTYRSEKRLLDLLGKDMEHINSFSCQGKVRTGHALILGQLRLPGLLLLLQDKHSLVRGISTAAAQPQPHCWGI